MARGMFGAVIEELLELAGHHARHGDDVLEASRLIVAAHGRLDWIGPDADRFRTDRLAPMLRDLAELGERLDDERLELIRQADEQEAASSVRSRGTWSAFGRLGGAVDGWGALSDAARRAAIGEAYGAAFGARIADGLLGLLGLALASELWDRLLRRMALEAILARLGEGIAVAALDDPGRGGDRDRGGVGAILDEDRAAELGFLAGLLGFLDGIGFPVELLLPLMDLLAFFDQIERDLLLFGALGYGLDLDFFAFESSPAAERPEPARVERAASAPLAGGASAGSGSSASTPSAGGWGGSGGSSGPASLGLGPGPSAVPHGWVLPAGRDGSVAGGPISLGGSSGGAGASSLGTLAGAAALAVDTRALAPLAIGGAAVVGAGALAGIGAAAVQALRAAPSAGRAAPAIPRGPGLSPASGADRLVPGLAPRPR